jgi:hypothetical protein
MVKGIRTEKAMNQGSPMWHLQIKCMGGTILVQDSVFGKFARLMPEGIAISFRR